MDYFKRDGLDSVPYFRAPKSQRIKEGLPNNGQALNKRRPNHIKESLFSKSSATLDGRAVWSRAQTVSVSGSL